MLILLLALVVVALSVANDDAELERRGTLPLGATIADIADGPAEYVGARVTVSGFVRDVVSPYALTIAGGDGALLVVGEDLAEVEGNEFERGEVAQVTGPVTLFSLAEVEEETGLDLDAALLGDFNGRPAVIAENVNLTPRLEAELDERVTPSLADIADDPAEFEAQVVDLVAVVTDTFGERGVVLDRRVAVVAPDRLDPGIGEADVVRVVGVVEAFDGEDDFTRAFGFPIEGAEIDADDAIPVVKAVVLRR